MKNDYKIYSGDSIIMFSIKAEQRNKNFKTIIDEERAIEKYFSHTEKIFDGFSNNDTLILTGRPGYWFGKLVEEAEIIIAGGGIVWNEKRELLMIHRRGKWDLPKGKIEMTETIQEGAIREVEEETGVKIHRVEEPAIITYHVYRLKGKKYLKETSWFRMYAQPNQQNLTPQVKEDITEAVWVKTDSLTPYLNNTYRMIQDLMNQYLMKNSEMT